MDRDDLEVLRAFGFSHSIHTAGVNFIIRKWPSYQVTKLPKLSRLHFLTMSRPIQMNLQTGFCNLI